ncbi:MAG: helix-turn-helix transcriptional regulator [Proteobacteria bacterium]|nr:helix-turn-helix transcriptional regulator [Pseudomonadota bacterium]
MVSSNRIAEIGAVIGEPARAAMLSALMDGRALTATELARVAGITPQTASTHLARLIGSGLVKVEQQGRHRYHALASPGAAQMLEGLMQHASFQDWDKRKPRTGPRDEALRLARTCYDHLAGRLGVAVADAMIEQKLVEIDEEAGVLTDRGLRFFADAGIVLPSFSNRRLVARPLCRLCLDWSERRPHFAGRLGAAICKHGFEKAWIRRIDDTRAVLLTPKGQKALGSLLGIAPLNSLKVTESVG